ncbi:hypothetical protein RJ639_047527 [Escallonia herrerae]|uniref:Uncharacterized protein n=1 Tax=Escallonia herrerae TaxID=1293975 RepID=A0AA89AZC6_9ASTE|nr:hypothetical protein RJ639_047527 [Escallonia herrerae]
MVNAKALWESLERKYKTEDAGSKKFVVGKFLDFKMVDSKTVISQVQEFQLILHDIHAEGMVLGESFQVAALIEKLPPTWKDFKNYLKHKRKEMKLEDLIVRLRIEEDNRQSEKKAGEHRVSAAMELHFLLNVVMSVGAVGFLGRFVRLYHALLSLVPAKEARRKWTTTKVSSRKHLGDQEISIRSSSQRCYQWTPLLSTVVELMSFLFSIHGRSNTGMYNLIQESTATLLDTWESIIENQGGIADIKIDEHMRSFAGDVISRAFFGSNFSRNKEIFSKLRALEEVTSKAVLLLPIKSNRARWALEKEVRAQILKVVKERNEVDYENDLLQTLLDDAKNANLSPDSIQQFAVDNYKNIYQAGGATTVLATWC